MTISSQQGRQAYAGAGTTGPFPVPFKFFADSDVIAIRQSAAGVDTTLVLNVDYTLTGAGSEAGGSLTTNAAVVIGETLSVILDPPRTQQTDYVSNDAFPAESHERALDRLTQQNIRTRDIVERAVRLPDGDVNPLPVLPGAGARAGKFLRFADGSGNPEMATGIDQTQILSHSVIGSFLYPQTPAESAAVPAVDPVNPGFEPYDVRRNDARGDGATSDAAAFVDTIRSAAGRMVTAKSLTGTYRFPADLATSGNVAVRGEGASNGRIHTCLEFAGTGSVPTPQWDFSAATSYVQLKDLQVRHAAGIPVDTTHGIGLNFDDAPYARLNNLWVSEFDVGIKVTGQFFYNSLVDVISINNYTAGLQLTGSLLNGTLLTGGQFSRTQAGYGLDIQDGGSHVSLLGVYREGNALGGALFNGLHNVIDISPYSEGNGGASSGGIDVNIENIYPHWTAQYTCIGGYFDASVGAGASSKPRISLRKTRAFTLGCKFYNDAATPPIEIADARGYQSSVHIGNEYNSATLTNATNEQASQVIIDSKHPAVYFSDGPPEDVNAHVGSTWINKDVTTYPHIFAWRANVQGRLGSPPAITTTATTSVGSKVVTISVSNNNDLFTGEYIQIAGVTFNGASFAMVLDTKSNSTVVLDKVADQAVAGAAISYKVGALEEVPSTFEDSFTGTLSGMTAGTTGTVRYLRTGKSVKLFLDANITGTSNTTGLALTGMPAAILPVHAHRVPCWHIADNNVDLFGSVDVDPGGTFTILLARVTGSNITQSSSAFTAAGPKGLFAPWCCEYPLN